jgi:hypothetical protein
MSGRALGVGDDHHNDAWNLSKIIYDQNGYVVSHSGYCRRHSAATKAVGFLNLVTVKSSQR